MELDFMGVKLHYECFGSRLSSLTPVIMLHGWGCSITHFEPIYKEMEKDRLVIVPDFPAHGSSSEPKETWNVSRFADAILALLRQEKIDRCDVIAHSFGGRVAIWIASHHPERVNRMVLTGCAGLKAEPTPEQKRRSEEYQKKKKLALLIGKLPGLKGISKKLQDRYRRQYGSADYNALTPGMRKTFSAIVNEDLREYLGLIKASTLLVFGDKDTATPLWMGKIMEKEIPDAGLVVFEGDDHFAYLRQWPRFNAIVKNFLK